MERGEEKELMRVSYWKRRERASCEEGRAMETLFLEGEEIRPLGGLFSEGGRGKGTHKGYIWKGKREQLTVEGRREGKSRRLFWEGEEKERLERIILEGEEEEQLMREGGGVKERLFLY